MDRALVDSAVALAYGPFVLTALLFMLAWLLKLGGDASLLHWLVRMTDAPETPPQKRSGGK